MTSLTSENKKYFRYLFALAVVFGITYYYLYLKPEPFINKIEHFACDYATNPTGPDCTTKASTVASTVAITVPQATCPPVAQPPSKSIVSAFFGVGFNIEPVPQSSTESNINNVYLIEHSPTLLNKTLGGKYAVSPDGSLTIKIRNIQDTTQWWSIIRNTSAISTSCTTKSNIYYIRPYSKSNFNLQYANGNLTLRPFNTTDNFVAQQWILSPDTVNRGLPVLNYNPASLYSTEFDPYSTSTSSSSAILNEQNNDQVTNVVNAVKSGIEQYLLQIGTTNNTPSQVSASSLGTKDIPLNINLNLNDSSANLSGKSMFTNVDGTTSYKDILSILDKYETNSNDSNSKMLYNSSDLQSQINKTPSGCKLLDINDYTSNRVGSCNCKL
jgi:hypothetical protein